MNRCLSVVLAASVLVALSSAARAEQGMPSQSTLRAMGLYGMQVMSDREALSVRGMGYSSHSKAVAFGLSYAGVQGHGASAGSIDGFYAEGKHYASGAHGSIAGKIVITKGGKKRRRGPGGPGGPGGPWQNDSVASTTVPPNDGPPHHGGGHGGKVQVKATIVFAGGFAVSRAY